jgi:hypothetical protein
VVNAPLGSTARCRPAVVLGTGGTPITTLALG